MYSETEKNLATTYLFDQGEKDVNVYQHLFGLDQVLTMDQVEQKIEKYRQTKEYQDFYAQFARVYDLTARNHPFDFSRNESFISDYATHRYFFIAGERKISPEQILQSISMPDLFRSGYYQERFGQHLVQLGANVQLKPWERLIADTVYFNSMRDYEISKNRIALQQRPDYDTKVHERINLATNLINARNELAVVTNNYRVAFNAYPPLTTAVSEIYGLLNYNNNENIVLDTIRKYRDDELSVSSIADHLRKEHRKEEENTLSSPAQQFTGLITPGIAAALLSTSYFQSIIGSRFDRISPSTLNETTIGVSNTYLQHIDEELKNLEESIAMKEVHPEAFKDELAKERARLPELREISRKAHLVMDEINANLTTRATYEQQAIEGILAAEDVRQLGKSLELTPPFLQSDYFRNGFGYQLENLYGRELSQGDLYLILRYKEFLAQRIDTLEATLAVIAAEPQPDKEKLHNLWATYASDSELLNTVNQRLQQYNSLSVNNHQSELVQLVYQPSTQTFSTSPAFLQHIGPHQIIDPLTTKQQAQSFITSINNKLTAHGITQPITYPTAISEYKCWHELTTSQSTDPEQVYQAIEISDNPGTVLPANLRDNMLVFYEMERKYEKYINDVKYDIAHPEFIGVWQTDENYWDRENLMKKDQAPEQPVNGIGQHETESHRQRPR